jgi:hypothetical protein
VTLANVFLISVIAGMFITVGICLLSDARMANTKEFLRFRILGCEKGKRSK